MSSDIMDRVKAALDQAMSNIYERDLNDEGFDDAQLEEIVRAALSAALQPDEKLVEAMAEVAYMSLQSEYGGPWRDVHDANKRQWQGHVTDILTAQRRAILGDDA